MSSILKIASILCSLALLVSFAAFASDEAGDGSKKTVAQIASADGRAAVAPPTQRQLNEPSPAPRVEKMREKAHSGFREVADDANDVLASPFTSLAGDGSIWAQRIVTGLLALLLFGAGLGFLSRIAALRGV